MGASPLVLVHGAQHGGWCWRRTLRPLRELGYEVHAVTLTGLGERAHLAGPEVDLGTHIADVVAVIEAEELTGVTVVGHSYGGIVAAGVGAALRSPVVRRVVYLDSVVPVDGDSVVSATGLGDAIEEARVVLDGVAVLPVGDAAAMGVRGADLAWVQRRLTPQPFAAVVAPVRLPAGWNDGVDEVRIRCVGESGESGESTDDGWRAPARDPGPRCFELRSGHDAMIDEPEALVALLHAACGG